MLKTEEAAPTPVPLFYDFVIHRLLKKETEHDG